MSKLSSFFADLAKKLKPILNTLFSTQKPKIKAFVHDKIDDFYNQFDHVTEVPTITGLTDYLKTHIGESGLGKTISDQLDGLVAVGIATGMVALGLRATDHITRDELDRIESYIDKQIDGARF